MTTETTERIAISRENLPRVIAKAFDLSKPQGMGFLHHKAGEIPDDVLSNILAYSDADDNPYRKTIDLDYVQGRALKLRIPYDDGCKVWHLEGDSWYDHGTDAWEELKQFAKAL